MQTEKSSSFFGQSLYIFTIRFFPVLANVLVFIYYGRSLDPAINGRYINFWAQLPLLTAIACAGVHVLLPTYSSGYALRLFRSIRSLQFGLYGLWICAAAFLFGAMQHYSGYSGFIVAFLFLLSNTFTIIGESFLITARAFRWVAVANLVYALLFTFAHWYVLANNVSFEMLFLSLLILSLARLLMYTRWIFSIVRASGQNDEAGPALEDARSLWIHMALYDISQLTFKWVDKVLISLMLTASLSAVYFYGTYDIPFLPVALGAVGSAALIDLSRNGTDDKYSAAVMLKSMRMLSALVFPLFFFLLFYRNEIFDLVFDHRYAASVPVFLAALLVVPLRACNFTVVLQNRHKGRIINTGAAVDLALACVLMYPFYLLWGLPGIAFAFTLTTYLQAAYYLYHTARLLNMRFVDLLPYRNWLLKLLAFALLFFALHFLTARYCPQLSALVIATIVMGLIASVTLAVELKAKKPLISQ